MYSFNQVLKITTINHTTLLLAVSTGTYDYYCVMSFKITSKILTLQIEI